MDVLILFFCHKTVFLLESTVTALNTCRLQLMFSAKQQTTNNLEPHLKPTGDEYLVFNTVFQCSIPLRLSVVRVVSDTTKWLQLPSVARVCHWHAHHYLGLHVHIDT